MYSTVDTVQYSTVRESLQSTVQYSTVLYWVDPNFFFGFCKNLIFFNMSSRSATRRSSRRRRHAKPDYTRQACPALTRGDACAFGARCRYSHALAGSVAGSSVWPRIADSSAVAAAASASAPPVAAAGDPLQLAASMARGNRLHGGYGLAAVGLWLHDFPGGVPRWAAGASAGSEVGLNFPHAYSQAFQPDRLDR